MLLIHVTVADLITTYLAQNIFHLLVPKNTYALPLVLLELRPQWSQTSTHTMENRTSDLMKFIPFRKSDLIEMCLAQNDLDKAQRQQFRQIAGQLTRFIHASFHTQTEQLKDTFSRINPDADTQQVELPATMHHEPLSFVDQLKNLLIKANYEQISESTLNRALDEASLFKVQLQVDFDDFAEVLLFSRSEHSTYEDVPRFFGLSKKRIEFTTYERVAIYIRLNEHLDEERQKALGLEPGGVVLKLFKNVPKADLEMLFPNTQIRMRLLDKLLIGVPAAISGGIVITTKLGGSLILLGSLLGFWLGLHNAEVTIDNTALIALFAGIGALGSYLFKQFNNFKNRKLRFVQSLTKNLYFKNLDNNAGVFHRLIDEAEEEECKEAILAYYFLLTSPIPLHEEQLDSAIETWLKERWVANINFEICDAMRKLVQMGLVTKNDDSSLTALPLEKAKRQLDLLWLKMGNGTEVLN